MNNEEKLNELEKKVDEAIQAGNTSDLNNEGLEVSERDKLESGETLDLSGLTNAEWLEIPESVGEVRADELDLTNSDKELIEEARKRAEEAYNQEQLEQAQVSESDTLEKGKQKTLTRQKFNSNGFAEGFLFTLLIGFASGAVFTIIYILIKTGKYTFIM